MKVSVKYFGVLAEKSNRSEEIIDLAETGRHLKEIKSFCAAKYGFTDLESIQLAVNEELATDSELKDGDIIAFLPPFAGG